MKRTAGTGSGLAGGIGFCKSGDSVHGREEDRSQHELVQFCLKEERGEKRKAEKPNWERVSGDSTDPRSKVAFS